MVFLQVWAMLGWLPTLASGDIASAFLQGRARSERDASLQPLFMEQPRGRGLPGLHPGQLVEVRVSLDSPTRRERGGKNSPPRSSPGA